MSKKKHKRNTQQTPERPSEAAMRESTDPDEKRKLKPVPNTHDENGKLLKLKRASFPYNRNGIIAYCDYRIEYWQIKKTEMLKKADPADKVRRKRDKLIAKLKEVDAQLEAITPEGA